MHSNQLRLLKIARELEAACKGDCDCDCDKSDATDATEAVWQDPNQFSLSENGPPYLRAKLASTDRAVIAKEAVAKSREAKQLLNRVAEAWATRPGGLNPLEAAYSPLFHLLTIYKAVATIHQAHHWLTHGPQYYGDHLLFERLYDETNELVDGIAERAIGLNGPIINPVDLAQRVSEAVAIMCEQDGGFSNDPAAMAARSRGVVLNVIQAIRVVIEFLKAKDLMTDGLDDLLPAHASKLEGHAYLTRQRVA